VYEYKFTIAEVEVEVPADPVKVLSGILQEKGTKTPLAGLAIEVEGTEAVAISDEKGRFDLYDLKPGAYFLVVPASQYKERRRRIKIQEGEVGEFTLRLEKDPFAEFRTVVRSAPTKETSRSLQTSELQKMPGTGGDALKAIQNLPSVARAPGGAGLLIIRGSSPEDTIFRVDNLFIPQLYHFGGIRSVINTDLIESIDFYPGGFSAKHGNATAGLVDVKLKSGRTDRWGGYVDVNVFDTTAFASGPINDDGALTFSARRSYIDAILNLVAGDELLFTAAPVYYDYQAQWDQKLTKDDTLRLTAYGSDDSLKLFFDDPPNEDPAASGGLGSKVFFHGVQSTWEHRFNNDLSMKSSLVGVKQQLQFNFGSAIDFNLELMRLGWREDFSWKLHRRFDLDFGMDVDYVFGNIDITAPYPPKEGGGSEEGGLSNAETLSSQSETIFGDRAFYLESTYRPIDPLEITTGGRVDWFGGEYKTVTVDPRANIRYSILPTTVLKAGAGQYHRRPDFDELDVTFGVPDLLPEESIQTYVGLEQEIVDGLTVDIQGFYKHLDNFVSVVPTDLEKGNDDAADVFDRTPRYDNAAGGRVYGGELLLRQQFGRWFWGWVAYTLSRSERQDRPGDDFRLFDFDQTHVLTLIGSTKLPWELELGIRLRYVTGTPSTPVERAVLDADTGTYVPVSGEINSARMPDFFQVDIRLDKTWNYDDWNLQGYIEVQNATNQANGEGYSYNYNYSERNIQSGLPIIPGFGLKASF
jgi:hypothetical protein